MVIWSALIIRAMRFTGLSKKTRVCVGNEIVPVKVTPEGYVMSWRSIFWVMAFPFAMVSAGLNYVILSKLAVS